MDIEQVMAIQVRIVAGRMSDDELAAINNAMQVDWDPRQVMGYEKAQSLFSQDNGTRAHELTKQAYAAEVLRRLSGPS